MKKLLIGLLPSFSFLFTFISLPLAQAQVTRYEKVIEEVNQVHKLNPQNTKVFEIATSTGVPLIGIQIGDGEIKDLVLATHHGNEYGSTAVALALINQLAQNPIPSRTTYIIPVINVSGYNSNVRKESGLDPNRDWPGPCGNAHGSPFKLPSITAIGKFIEAHNFVMGITLHTYGKFVTYPWSFKYEMPTEHDRDFQALAPFATDFNKYRSGKTPDLVYTTLGDFESYAFWKHGIWAFLFEMGVSHSPSENEVAALISDNVPAIRNLLANGPAKKAEKHSFSLNCNKSIADALWNDLGDE